MIFTGAINLLIRKDFSGNITATLKAERKDNTAAADSLAVEYVAENYASNDSRLQSLLIELDKLIQDFNTKKGF